jgi:hypothetical protein
MNVAKKLLRAAIASAGAQMIAFRSSATSGANTITAPSDIAEGDLLVLYDRATNTSGVPTSVVPSGFTSILDEAHEGIRRTICSFKIANGTEASATITGMDGNSADVKTLIVFSTGGASSAIAYDVAFQSTDADATAQVVNASSGSPPLVVIAFIRQVTTTSQSFSPAQDGTVANGQNTGYYKIYNSSPADVTVDCGDGGNANALMSFYIEVN